MCNTSIEGNTNSAQFKPQDWYLRLIQEAATSKNAEQTARDTQHLAEEERQAQIDAHTTALAELVEQYRLALQDETAKFENEQRKVEQFCAAYGRVHEVLVTPTLRDETTIQAVEENWVAKRDLHQKKNQDKINTLERRVKSYQNHITDLEDRLNKVAAGSSSEILKTYGKDNESLKNRIKEKDEEIVHVKAALRKEFS
jgi:hypothetical protein